MIDNLNKKTQEDYEKEFKRIDSLTEEEARREARLNLIDLQDTLEKKAKRVKPEVFVPKIARLFHDPKRKFIMGPHTYLQAIEANCTFHKEGYNETLDQNKLASIYNLCLDSEAKNTFYLWIIHDNINLFHQFIYRIQMEIQKTGLSNTHLARYWMILYDNIFTPRLFEAFQDKYKITIKNWFLCSLCIYTLFYKQLEAFKHLKLPAQINLTQKDIQTYSSYTTCSIEEVKNKYTEERKKLSREFHFLIRSYFIERPILNLNETKMIAPIPGLIIRNMGKGLINMFEQIDKNGYHLGQSFERYTESVLRCLRNSLKIFTENELKKQLEGEKHCDFLIVTPTENILLECKAIDFRVRTLTENAISNSSASTRIIDAIEQLAITSNNIQTDKLTLEGLDKTKPTIGVVVTLGEIPGLNTDWFFEKALPLNEMKNIDTEHFQSFLQNNRPVILSIDSLEELVVYLDSSSDSFFDLYTFKMQKEYYMTGDWDAFLNNKLKEIDKVEKLDFVNECVAYMYKELGVEIEPDSNDNFRKV